MECKWCGNIIESKARIKLFCDRYCMENYRQTQCTFSPRVSARLSMKEVRKRKRLFKRARGGDEVAKRRLRIEYGITAIWDGKKLVRL